MCVLELLDCFILYLSPLVLSLSFSLSLFSPACRFFLLFKVHFYPYKHMGGGDECRFVTFSIVVNYLV